MLKKYFKDFIKQEDGIETMEVAIIVAIAAALVGILLGLGSSVNTTVKNQAEGYQNTDFGQFTP